jgi:hypothetical protein
MDGRLQLRVRGYGWDRASTRYEALWREALAPATQGGWCEQKDAPTLPSRFNRLVHGVVRGTTDIHRP